MTSIPIGRPVSNSTVYILDRGLRPLPVGVVGEIFIGGDGVALGYLNGSELTAERFLADPFNPDPKARIYKTGDLGKWRSDGTIEYVGRNDEQVKIRGFRVELGEIEAQLVAHAQLREAVVVAKEDMPGEKRLVGYVIAKDPAEVPTAENLREHLKGALPEYMVPSAFVVLEAFPLTPNGKLNRRALPAPDLSSYSSRAYEAPRGQVEEVLAGIWRELLHVERVGRKDNFFELGGHSLLVINLMAAIRTHLGVSLPISAIFRYSSMSEFAGIVESLSTSDPGITTENEEHEEGMIPLTQLRYPDRKFAVSPESLD